MTDILGFDGVPLTSTLVGTIAYGSFQNLTGTVVELFSFDPTTIANSGGISFVTRGLSFNEDGTFASISANKLTWVKGVTIIQLGTDAPQLFAYLKNYIDAAAIAGAVPASTTTLGIAKLSVAPASAPSPIVVGDNDPRVPTTAQVAAIPSSGIISMYGGASAPTGWLLCDGSAVSRATYAALFGVLSTSYGVGDGSTTFNLPDLRSSVALGAGTRTKVFTFVSRSSNTITASGMTNSTTNQNQTGQAVTYHSATTVMTGLSNDTVYYLIRTAYNTFQLASTLANAQNGTAISLSSDGAGVQTFTINMTARSVGDTGGQETHAMSATELLAHVHTMTIPAGNGSGGVVTAQATNNGALSQTTNSTGGNVAMPIMNPFTVITYIIKT